MPITFDDFKKVELRIGKVLEAEDVTTSEKLLKLKVDIGGGQTRQLIAGIKKQYQGAELVGKLVVVAANLEPRQVMGIESQGMVLCATGEAGPVILQPNRDVPPGSEVR